MRELTIIVLALFLPLGIRALPFIDDNLESLYSAYKLIEDTVKSDQKLIFKINQAFSPVVNFRYWQVDGAEVVPIEVCVTLHEQPSVQIPCNTIGVSGSNKVMRNCTACWNFQWTNSLLLNLIPGDILLAMDPTIPAFLYSGILHSSHHRRLHLDLHLNDSLLLQKYSLDDYEQAFALFITSGKVTVDKADSSYRGYIAKWYTYFNSDSYFSKLNLNAKFINHTLFSLWVTFSLLNIVIPILSITRGRQMFQWVIKITATLNPRVRKATIWVLMLFNFLWLLLGLVQCISGHPNLLNCFLRNKFHRCSIPPTSTSYSYIIGILITKAIILPIAFLTELAAAARVAKGTLPLHALYTKMKAYRIFILRAFIIWQLLVFVQITMGLFSIPLFVLTLVSPGETMLSSGGLILVLLLPIFIFVSIPIPNKLKNEVHVRCCLSITFTTVETFTVAAFLFSTYWSYYTIVRNGMSMDGIKGYVISLIPSFGITVLLWIVKKRFLTGKGSKEKASEQKSRPTSEKEISALPESFLKV